MLCNISICSSQFCSPFGTAQNEGGGEYMEYALQSNDMTQCGVKVWTGNRAPCGVAVSTGIMSV